MGRDPAGPERNGLLRLLSLELAFADPRCAELVSDERLLSAMARFEGALALAGAAAGIVPAAEAQIIARVCAEVRLDARALALEARHAGALAIPFVRQLTRHVAAASPQAARYVHFGATSQDVSDTAMVLCLREAAERVLELSTQLGDAAAALALRHARTPTLARTLLQPALPVPFGWKAAVWLGMLARDHGHFRAAAREASVLQLGGPGGTLSAFGAQGEAVVAALAAELELAIPELTWHSARDRLARVGAEAAQLTGVAAKIARDISLLMQPEVGEVFEPAAAGRGGSSAMPHKRNPALSLLALEAAQRAPALAATLLGQLAPEHERGLGHWQSQWSTLRQLVGAAASALGAMAEALSGLEVDEAAMRANIERSRGLVYSEAVSVRLARELGKSAAHALTEKLCEAVVRGQSTLLDALRADPSVAHLIPASELERLFQPESCFGAAGAMIDRALAQWQAARA